MLQTAICFYLKFHYILSKLTFLFVFSSPLMLLFPMFLCLCSQKMEETQQTVSFAIWLI